MVKTQGIKYPKALAKGETSTRQKLIDQLYAQPSLFEEEELKALGKIEELKKSLFSFNAYESIIFDGLCKLCMEAYNGTHSNLLLKIEKGIEEHIDVIERLNNPTETHYRSVLSLEETQKVFCGDNYKMYWPLVYENIKRLAYELPKKRCLVLGKKLYIDTVPLKIDLIYEDGSDSKKLKTLGPRLTKEKIIEGKEYAPNSEARKIVGIDIEYYKPLFLPVIELNKRKKPGTAYIITPPYFQLSIISTIERLETSVDECLKGRQKLLKGNGQTLNWAKETTNIYIEHLKESWKNLICISPLEMRRFYLYLALHDNHKGAYITIENLMDFVESCFPGLIDSDRDGNRKLYPSRYKELIEKKLEPMLYLFKIMTHEGEMDGGQLVPLKLSLTDMETGEEFGKKTNNLRIECMKSKSFFSNYTLEKFSDELADLTKIAPYSPKMLGNSN